MGEDKIGGVIDKIWFKIGVAEDRVNIIIGQVQRMVKAKMLYADILTEIINDKTLSDKEKTFCTFLVGRNYQAKAGYKLLDALKETNCGEADCSLHGFLNLN